MKKTRLTFREYVSVASMLFGMFFGAGNLIFPVSVGQQAGSSLWTAFAGLVITAVGLPLLGVIPEDEGIPIALGRSALTVFSRESSAEIACRNIARRLTGERVPLMKLPRR